MRGRVVLKGRSPSTEGKQARGMVLSRLGRRCERGNFHIEIKSCGESRFLSRSSEQVATREYNGHDLSIPRGHSQAIARAPWIRKSLRHADEEPSSWNRPFDLPYSSSRVLVAPISKCFKSVFWGHLAPHQMSKFSSISSQTHPPIVAIRVPSNAPRIRSCPFIVALGHVTSFTCPFICILHSLHAFKIHCNPHFH